MITGMQVMTNKTFRTIKSPILDITVKNLLSGLKFIGGLLRACQVHGIGGVYNIFRIAQNKGKGNVILKINFYLICGNLLKNLLICEKFCEFE